MLPTTLQMSQPTTHFFVIREIIIFPVGMKTSAPHRLARALYQSPAGNTYYFYSAEKRLKQPPL